MATRALAPPSHAMKRFWTKTRCFVSAMTFHETAVGNNPTRQVFPEGSATPAPYRQAPPQSLGTSWLSSRWPSGSCCSAQVGVATAASGRVAVFPVPGSKYNRPQTQITFRGVPASQLGSVRVLGSQTGAHSGHIAADSDGQGASFLPDQPFAAGETVTVTTDLSLIGSGSGTFSFQIAQPWGLLPYGKLPLVSAGRNGCSTSVHGRICSPRPSR